MLLGWLESASKELGIGSNVPQLCPCASTPYIVVSHIFYPADPGGQLGLAAVNYFQLRPKDQIAEIQY
jgi:hypothetical protein